MNQPMPRSFFARDPREVAPELLNAVLVHDDPVSECRLAVRIVDVEAYGGAEDPGSHAFRGPTRRNATMFGPPGRLYVYFTYGMHWCANVVAHTSGRAGAVLLRGAAPLEGVEVMRARRTAARRDRELCSGPARLTQALGIDGAYDAADLRGGPLRLQRGDVAPPSWPGRSIRVGLGSGRGDQHEWRWFVADDAHRGPGPAGSGR